MTQHEFRKNYHVDMSRQIELVKLVFMRYQHPDMQEMKTFLKGPSERYVVTGLVSSTLMQVQISDFLR